MSFGSHACYLDTIRLKAISPQPDEQVMMSGSKTHSLRCSGIPSSFLAATGICYCGRTRWHVAKPIDHMLEQFTVRRCSTSLLVLCYYNIKLDMLRLELYSPTFGASLVTTRASCTPTRTDLNFVLRRIQLVK